MGKRKGKGRGNKNQKAKRDAVWHDREEGGRGLSDQKRSTPSSDTSDTDARRDDATTAANTCGRDSTKPGLHESLGLLRLTHAGARGQIMIQCFDRCQNVDNSTRPLGACDVARLSAQQLHVERVLRISFVKALHIDWNVVCVNVVELMQHARRRVRASRAFPFLNHDAVMLQRARERRDYAGSSYHVRAENTQVYQSILETWAHWCQQEGRLAMKTHDPPSNELYHRHVDKMEAYAASLFDAFEALRIDDQQAHAWFPHIRAWREDHRHGADTRSGQGIGGEPSGHLESSSISSDWVTPEREEDVDRLSRSKGVPVAEMRAHMHAVDVVCACMSAIKAKRNASCHQLTAYTLKQYVGLLSDPRGVEMLSAHWTPTPNELHMWTRTVRLFFGDLFAGGQCSYDDCDEDLQVYRIHNIMAATNEEHDSHDGQSESQTATGTLVERAKDDVA